MRGISVSADQITAQAGDKLLLQNLSFQANGGQAVVLSGGEKRRLGLARLLYKQGQVVYADEPTASLAAANRQLVTDLLLYVTSLLLPLQLGYRKDAISLLYTLLYGRLLSKKSKTEVKRTIGRKG